MQQQCPRLAGLIAGLIGSPDVLNHRCLWWPSPLEAVASGGRGLLLETALSCQSPELSAWSPHGTATLASRTARIGLGNSGQYILSPCVSEPI
jgi:hypothetical protein